jgi:drug/metabolite transporter (DMT)-like permease
MAPVFGRQAILLGIPALAVVAIRTSLAALLLLVVMLVFFRRYLYIYPAGLLGCLLAGWINGFGSLFYYFALGRISASMGQLLYSLYPLFLALWLSLDKQPPSRLTIFRLALVLPAVYLLVTAGHGTAASSVDLIGVGAMLLAAMLYALHLPFNQRVLYDMPPQTVTLYTLLAMSAVVIPPFLFSEGSGLFGIALQTEGPQTLVRLGAPLLGLTLVTFFSRLLLFSGIKHLGGMQTALLGLGELLVTLLFAHLWLGESFSLGQWIGVGLLITSLVLVGLETFPARKSSPGGFLSWLRPASRSVAPLTDTWHPNE